MTALILPCSLVFLLLAAPPATAGGSHELDVVRVETAIERCKRLDLPIVDGEPAGFTHRVPGQAEVQVATVVYDRESGLEATLYYPPSVDPESPDIDPLPVVMIPQAFALHRYESYGVESVQEFPFWLGWGVFFAMHGTVCVQYDALVLHVAYGEVMAFLEHHHETLGLDLERLAILGTSGQGQFAELMTGHESTSSRLDAAVFTHGDPQGLSFLKTDAAFLVVHSGDQSRWSRFSRALVIRARRAGMEVIETDDAPFKNFMEHDDSPRSHEVMRTIGEFIADRLDATPAFDTPGDAP